jgi:uncharacterized protein (DUF1697 family)
MTTYIGLLRAVNLGPHNRVAMKDLAALLAKVGMQDVRTLLASGNVIFRSDNASPEKLEKLFEDAVAKKMKVDTDFFVRSASEWQAIVTANPYSQMAKDDPGHLIMMCLKAAPPAASVDVLQKAIKGRETVKAKGRQAYFVYPDGVGSSKLTIKMIEKLLATNGTARNWNTVLKLLALTADEK